MNEGLSGQSILVTGAGSGIGRATALALARHGARLALWDVDEEVVAHLARELQGQGTPCHALCVDVTSPQAVERATARSIELLDGLDGAFNNAGVGGPTGPLEQIEEVDFDRIVAVNLKGVWLCMKQQLLHMRGRRRGAIVNNASVSGLVGLGGQAAYTASKHGVVGLTKAAAIEAAPDNIRINAVCPGAARTPLLRHLEAAGISEDVLSGMSPLARVASPEEIAQSAVWLLSDSASFVTGTAVPIDGGWSAQ